MHFLSPALITDMLVNWGYLGIFLCVFVGNLGLPVPEETVVLAAGFLAGQEILELRTVYLVVVLSAITGDSCGYLLGRTGGQRLIERLAGRFEFVRIRYERIQSFFSAHGPKAVFMARFITGARFMAGPMAGAAGMKFWRFFGWNVLGALIWCGLMVGIGYLVVDYVDELWRIIHLTHRAGQIAGLTAIVLGLAFYLYWRREHHRSATKA
ncbi:MAG TPA: DedA family protein [Candidatus Binataceae bacterium]|nr:DedA family protein [Candidatus Binataceae bacterium]